MSTKTADQILKEEAEKFMLEAQEYGFSTEQLARMDRDVVVPFENKLPAIGKFTEWAFKGDKNNPNSIKFAVMETEKKGEQISLSAAVKFYFTGEKEQIQFRKQPETSNFPGSYTLTGVKCVNPDLLMKPAELAAFLKGKKFKATPVKGIIAGYKADTGFLSEEEARAALSQWNGYKITILD